jgi:hypothetical protein
MFEMPNGVTCSVEKEITIACACECTNDSSLVFSANRISPNSCCYEFFLTNANTDCSSMLKNIKFLQYEPTTFFDVDRFDFNNNFNLQEINSGFELVPDSDDLLRIGANDSIKLGEYCFNADEEQISFDGYVIGANENVCGEFTKTIYNACPTCDDIEVYATIAMDDSRSYYGSCCWNIHIDNLDMSIFKGITINPSATPIYCDSPNISYRYCIPSGCLAHLVLVFWGEDGILCTKEITLDCDYFDYTTNWDYGFPQGDAGSGTLSIIGKPSDFDLSHNNANLSFTVSPEGSTAIIQFELSDIPEQLSLELLDMDLNVVTNIPLNVVNEGINTTNLGLSGLPLGKYYLVLNTSNETSIISISIE